jgi:hypothetical protein
VNALTPLQKREVFHLLFLRELVRTVPLSAFVLKGGTNLRFFFGSIRYSEDMDLDASGLDEGVRVEPVAAEILAAYRMPPVIVPHYDAHSAAMQKVVALFSRALPQTRDIFDLYLLSSRPEVLEVGLGHGFAPESIQRARDRIDSIGYRQYRDTVVDFLGPEDRAAHDSPSVWDEIRLRVLDMFEGNVRDGSQA